MCGVKVLVLALSLFGLLFAAQEVDGNFTIRFEPTAKLQANVEVPFTVHVTDDRGKPLLQDDHVQMTIAPENQPALKTIKAWFVAPGEFIAKPVFPSDGQWSITVEARRRNQVTRRTITFQVAP
jgi:nitrogen fixation protein FixH